MHDCREKGRNRMTTKVKKERSESCVPRHTTVVNENDALCLEANTL